MGITQKIKDAIHHDSPNKTSTYENDKPPGSFPSDTTGTKHNKMTDGRDYTTSGTTGTTGTTGTSGTTDTTGTTGLSRHSPTSNIHGGATGDLTGTGMTGHRPTDSGVDVGNGPGRTRTGEQGTSQSPYWGSMGRESHGVTGGSGTSGLAGSDARTGYDDPAGTHGPHNTRTGNLADPRVDSDRDHRGVSGSGLTGHNDRSNIRTGYDDPSGTHGPHNTRAANVADPRVDSDRDHRDAPYSAQKDLPLRPNEQYGAYGSRGQGPQAVGGGTYNPMSTAGHHDPTSNVDRSLEGRDFTHTNHGGSNGPGAGAQAQYGVQNPVQNPSLIGANSNDPYDTRMRDRDMGRDRTGHGIAGGVAGAGLGAAASKTAHSHHHDDLHDSGYVAGNTSGSQTSPSNTRGGVDNYSRSGPGLTGHEPGVPKTSMLDPYNDSSAATSQGISGGRNGSPPFNQGHEGAKVMHTCSHCGRDNDISRYFKKDAVYRMN